MPMRGPGWHVAGKIGREILMFQKGILRTFRRDGNDLTVVLLPEEDCFYLAIGSGMRSDHLVRLAPDRMHRIAEILRTGRSDSIGDDGPTDARIRILTANRGEPWEEGFEISFISDNETLEHAFLETRDATEIAALVLEACERMEEVPGP